MTLSRRYRWVLLLAGTATFVVVALVVAVWPLVGGKVPAGTHPAGALATLTVRNTDGNVGLPSAGVESLLGIPGVRSVHYSRTTMVRLAQGDSENDEVVAYVNDGYFRSLGIRVETITHYLGRGSPSIIAKKRALLPAACPLAPG